MTCIPYFSASDRNTGGNTPMSSNRAVFLDKDGTLIEDVPYNVDPARILLAPGAGEGLRLLAEAGFHLFVVSNQSGVAHGYFEGPALEAVTHRVNELLAAHGVRIEAFYFCPHHPEGRVAEYARHCGCRKPESGLILRAAADHRIDLARSWCIGDILNDVEAGRRAGCQTVLLMNGHETEWLQTPERRPHYCCSNLAEAARLILLASRAQNAASVERAP